MKNVIVTWSCALCLVATPLAAQTGSGSGSGSGSGRDDQATTQVDKKVAETQAIAQKMQEAQLNPRFVRTLTNVQIELTISDQIGSAAPDKKVISMMTADATMGRVRATADSSKGPTSLNVDARPVALDNDRILLELTVEFAPLRESQISQRPTVLNESISVILQNGKPMVVSQAADPISDRKMMVEVKATIVK